MKEEEEECAPGSFNDGISHNERTNGRTEGMWTPCTIHTQCFKFGSFSHLLFTKLQCTVQCALDDVVKRQCSF